MTCTPVSVVGIHGAWESNPLALPPRDPLFPKNSVSLLAPIATATSSHAMTLVKLRLPVRSLYPRVEVPVLARKVISLPLKLGNIDRSTKLHF